MQEQNGNEAMNRPRSAISNTLCAGARARIGERLRAEFGGMELEGLPTRHVELLLELRRVERERARMR